MEKDYISRLQQAKEAMLGSKRDEGNHRNGSRDGSDHKKKKKKHKDDRQNSPSRHKKKHSDSPSRKHKKHHKHKDRDSPREHRHRNSEEQQRDKHRSRDYERDRERERDHGRDRDKSGRDRDYGRTRDHGRDRDNGRDRDYGRDRDHGRQRDRDYGRDRQPKHKRREDKPVEQKDPYYQKRRQIERIRRGNSVKAEQLQNELQKQILLDRKEKELAQAKEKFKEAQKEMEQAKREDMTILVYCLPLKAKEKDIWNFFSKTNCGKIRDIRIIRDARSGRSKGVAYVEFYNSESVQRALTMIDRPFELKGRSFMGLKVQHSQAQKNRAAAAAKQMRVIKPADPIEQQQEQIRRQTKVFVSGLVQKLSDITEKQLKELFDPFGQIEYVDIHRDPQTGHCKGYAFIQYVDPERAKAAVKEMNGLTITGNQRINVQMVQIKEKGQITGGEDYLYNAGSKANLMNKLQGTTGPSYSNLQRPPISTVTTPYLIMTNMFKMENTSPVFFDQLKKEVQKQVEEYGVVERIFIEKNNQGNIWIKYSDTASAIKAQENLNGKYFDGHKIFIYFVTQNTYQARVGM